MKQAMSIMAFLLISHINHDISAILSGIEDYTIQEETPNVAGMLKPCSDSSVKSYMDRAKITNTASDQHAYIEEHMEAKIGHWFDKEGYVGVALGSWFGSIGTRWIFYLSSGEVLHTVKIEEKSDEHTINGCQHITDGSVIEFVIDQDTNTYWIGSNGLIVNGNYNNLDHFNGNIEWVKKESTD